MELLKQARNDGGVSEDSVKDAETELLNAVLGPKRLAEIDPFEQAQIAYVIRVCRESRSQSDAVRKLFRVSRLGRKHTNDADRLTKYLARFGLTWAECTQ